MIGDLFAFLLPVPCVGCGREGRLLCRGCAPELQPRLRSIAVAGVGPVVAGLGYDGVPRAALLAFKESGATALAASLAPALAAAVSAQPGWDAVVAVPSTRAARRRRGYEPTRLLAARAGLRLSPAFASAAPHAVQKGLGISARAANLTGVFRLAAPVAGRRILLVDDIVTTGATLAAAAAVLRGAGAEVVGAAVAAATPRRVGHPSRPGTSGP